MKEQITPSIQFENDHLQVSVERHPGCKVLFTIITLPIASKAARAAAARTIGKQVNIPGFRKGHAPQALITQQFSGQIENEFRDILLKNSVNEAIQLTKIRPVSNEPSLKVLKFDPLENDSYTISIEFEAYPEIPTVDLSSLSSKEIAPSPVTEEEFAKRIEDLRLRNAEWIEITDRPAKEGDFVTLDVEIIEESPKLVNKDSRFYLKEKRMPEWARLLVSGLSVGEAKEGLSEPENGEDPATYKPNLCRFTVKRIQEVKWPELNDALAKKAGVDTVELLNEAIKRSIEKNEHDKALNQMRLAMKNQLEAQYQMDLPKSQTERAYKESFEIADGSNIGFPNEEARKQYALQVFTEAQKTLRSSYLLPKILRDHQIAFPNQAQIQQRATEHMMMRYLQGDTSITENDLQYFSRVAENELITESALDYLIENCKRA